MTEPLSKQIRDIFDALYGPAAASGNTGGLCTPESGCRPADRSAPDLLKVLTGAAKATAETTDEKTEGKAS